MKKYISAFLIVAAFAAMLLMSACNKQEQSSLELSTTLDISRNFSGKRTITMTVPPSVAAPSSEQAEKLETIIRRHCPEEISYDSISGDSVIYTFTLEFSSLSDYTSKLTRILGTPPTVVFANPSTPVTKGWRIQEFFQSSQLLSFIRTGAKAEKADDIEVKFTEPSTTAVFNNSAAKTTPTISVNNLSGAPIASIKVSTLNRRSSYDRTISFTISKTSYDTLGTEFSDYFKSITDPSAETSWQLEEDHYIYTAEFTELTIKELEGYTNRLLASVYCDAEYLDKTQGSTPLARQNSFTETLDFSNYIAENKKDVPVEYSYAISDGTRPEIPLIYSDLEWTAASMPEPESTGFTINSASPSLTLRVNDGKQYTPVSIDISLTPLDGDMLSKTYLFRYDLAAGGTQAADYTLSYFSSLDLMPSQYIEAGQAVCKLTFTGTAAELNSKITDVFGDGNLISSDSAVPFFTMRTKRTIEDTNDLSSLLVGKNIDTPVNYFLSPQEGDNAESLSLIHPKDTAPEYAERGEENGFSMNLDGCEGTFTAIVSTANWSDIITLIIISVILVLAAVGMILFMLTRRLPSTGLPSGSRTEKNQLPSRKERPEITPVRKRSGKKPQQKSKTDTKDGKH